MKRRNSGVEHIAAVINRVVTDLEKRRTVMTDNKKPLAVYTIVKSESDKDDFWQRIGTAFHNRDNSITVKLNALPVNGTLHIRENEPKNRQSQNG